MDARLIQGNAMSVSCWKDAHAKNMDYLIAVTDNDAINMLSAMVADRFDIPTKIARVRSQDFGHSNSLLKGEDLKVDLFIHPEELAAQEIVRMIKRTAGDEIIDIALGQMQVMATRITQTSPFAFKNLIDISKTYSEFPFRVVAIARGISTVIPSGEHEILPQDQVLIMADKKDLPKLMELTGVKQHRRHRVMILGGGLVGSRIAELLGKLFASPCWKKTGKERKNCLLCSETRKYSMETALTKKFWKRQASRTLTRLSLQQEKMKPIS